jgi:hypothetical protein
MSSSRPFRTTTSVAGEPSRVRMDGTRAEPDASRPGGRLQGGGSNTSYERYKQQLHAFFNGDKPLPDHLKTMLATRPGASEHGFAEGEAEAEVEAPAAEPAPKAKKGRGRARPEGDEGPRRRVVAANAEDIVLADAIRKASSPREVQGAVDALLGRGYPLPLDADVLGKALGHGDDAVLEKVLTALQSLVVDGGFKGNATLLKTRLKNVALLSSSTTVRELCAAVGGRL